MLTNATTDNNTNYWTTELPVTMHDSNCITEDKELWHAGLKYNQTWHNVYDTQSNQIKSNQITVKIQALGLPQCRN